MKSLELKIPPLVTLLIAAVLAWFAARWTSTPLDFVLPEKNLLFSAVAVLGVAVTAYAVIMFRRERTTVNPVEPSNASALVTSGVFRFTRNPMYVGMLLVLSGWVVYLGSATGFLSIVFFITYMTRFQIRPEEKILTEVFGQPYSDYCSNVRRWL